MDLNLLRYCFIDLQLCHARLLPMEISFRQTGFAIVVEYIKYWYGFNYLRLCSCLLCRGR